MLRYALVPLLALFPSIASAHKPSDSYLTISAQGQRVAGQWDIALRDLDFAIGLDADGDGNITWGEVRAKFDEIDAYALARLAIAADGADCPIIVAGHLIDNHSDGAYAVLPFAAICPRPPETLSLTYRLFFDIDRQHKGLLRLEAGGATRAAVFAPDSPHQTFALSHPDRLRQFQDYFITGVDHIWRGYDHILFLLSLLLPAVMVLGRHGWEPSKDFRGSVKNVLEVVTAFTIAHSITLSLATLQIISLPARVSESAIALTVSLAALNNVEPIVRGRRWALGFGFGFIHGFGFATVLADLGLSRGALALALVGSIWAWKPAR
jgi:hypothetical protein